MITPPTIDHRTGAGKDHFTITWHGTAHDGSFRGHVRFVTAEQDCEIRTGTQALLGLALCLARILDRGFACSPQCSGDLVCLEADSLSLELVQTSMVVELIFSGTTGPDMRTSQVAFHDGVIQFLRAVLEWVRDQPTTVDGNELAALVGRIQAATTPVIGIAG